MTIRNRVLTLTCVLACAMGAARADDLDDVRARKKIEAQRVEAEFADERAAAYKLVRSDDPKLVEATEKLQTLLAMVRADSSLDSKRREVFIVTLKADMDRVAQIAAERRRATGRRDADVQRGIRQDATRTQITRGADTARGVSQDAKSIYESRARAVADSRLDRGKSGDAFSRVMRDVDDSAVPDGRTYTLPKNWAELSAKRSTAIKMTAKEKAIMKALGTTVSADFDKNKFDEVIDYFRKATGVDISVDPRALTEVNASYDSPVTLRQRSSLRTVLKRVLADMNLTYVIKDEAIQITSRERASEMTTTRAYYVGDLASVVDLNLGPALAQLQMIENVNRLITSIQQQVAPGTWRPTNPDGAGTIVFDPITMSIVVKQTAEVHFVLGGYK